MRAIKIQVVLVGAALVASAGWLGACTSQPNAGCPILASNPQAGVPPYWVRYTKISATGDCGNKKGEQLGFQKYAPGTSEQRLAYRFENLGHHFAELGRVDPADPNGVNINGFAKIPAFPAADNFCEVTEFKGAPKDGGSYEAPSQRFEAVPAMPIKLSDGGMGLKPGKPELFMKYEWTKLKFLATVNAPVTVLSGELRYTEDNCTAVFSAFGHWPAVNPLTGEGCEPAFNDPDRNGYNPQCDPTIVTLANYPNLLADGGLPDGGGAPVVTQFGSGINPTFQTKEKPITCGKDPDVNGVHHCQLQLSLDELSKL